MRCASQFLGAGSIPLGVDCFCQDFSTSFCNTLAFADGVELHIAVVTLELAVSCLADYLALSYSSRHTLLCTSSVLTYSLAHLLEQIKKSPNSLQKNLAKTLDAKRNRTRAKNFLIKCTTTMPRLPMNGTRQTCMTRLGECVRNFIRLL